MPVAIPSGELAPSGVGVAASSINGIVVSDGAGITVRTAVDAAWAGLAGLIPLMIAAITVHSPNASSKPMIITSRLNLLFTKGELYPGLMDF
jgi:hypothetical protein